MGSRFDFSRPGKLRQVSRAIKKKYSAGGVAGSSSLESKTKGLEGHTNVDLRKGTVNRLVKGASLGPASEGLSLRQQWETEATCETFAVWLYRKGLHRG